MRCKFVFSYKQPVQDGFHLHFNVVTSGSDENNSFFKYTPGGMCSLYTVNSDVADKMIVGKEYYLDFTEVI